jgi:signal transduction histidine kinase
MQSTSTSDQNSDMRGGSGTELAQALHRGTSLLGGDGTLWSILCHLLSNLAQKTGARDAVLWRYDFGADRYEFMVANSSSNRGGTRERARAEGEDWIGGLYPPSFGGQTRQLDPADGLDATLYTAQLLDSVGDTDPGRHWRVLRGTRSMAVLPLQLGEEHIAAVSLGFQQEVPLITFGDSLAAGLASQLSVALAVARLTAPAAKDDGKKLCERSLENAVKIAQVGDAMTEAAGELHDVDQLVPAVLRIISTALDIHEGALWENSADGPMRLRYWLHHGSVLSPQEFAERSGRSDPLTFAPEEEPQAIRTVAGQLKPHPAPSTSLVIEHPSGSRRTILDEYLQRQGCSLELHTPMFIRGLQSGALSIYRPASQEFDQRVVELAYSLTKRVALAQQVSRVSYRARVATVARERLAMVNRASDSLRRTADKLAEVPAVEPFLEQVLESLVETFDGCGGSLYWSDHGQVVLSLELEDGHTTRLKGQLHPNSQVLQTLLNSSSTVASRLKNGLATVVDAASLRPSHTVHAWMQWLGVQMLLIVPLSLGGRSFGCLSVRLAESRTLGEEDVELAKALSTQAVLAMELTRLAEEAKDKATAEARSAELMKANDALRSTLDVVASGAETDVVLSHALRVIAEQFESSNGGATLWLADDEAEKQRPYLAYQDDEAVHPSLSRFVATESFIPLEADPLFKQHFVEGQAFAVSVDDLKPDRADFLRGVGVRSVVTLPMSLRGRPVGSFTIYVSEEGPEPTCERMELAQALAHQATLVLQLTRLAEQAKLAAVASERESAALMRAAELTESNAALKRSLDVLASDADLNRFLGGLLSEIGKRVASDRVALYFEEEAGLGCTIRLGWSGELGVVKDADALVGADAAQALLHAIHSMSLRRLPHVHAIGEIVGLGRKDREALRAASVEAVLHIPLVLGERCLGSVVVLMPNAKQVPSESLELIQAFAHQATLAMHLAKLSAQSQSVAILQERARFAQEIHDGIVQSFIGISMQLNQMKGVEGCPARERAAQLAESGLAEARRAIKALRPLQLVSKSLIEAVIDMTRSVVGTAATIKVTTSGSWGGLPPDTENHLFRLIQEAVNNVVKHAKATEVAIEFSSSSAEASVLVSDNGVGFDMNAREPDHGFGLFSMRQRAESIGAKLAIVSARGKGTQVFVSLDRGPSTPSP